MNIAVPAYFHPKVAPLQWQALVSAASLLRFVVINPGSGPGADVDPAYTEVISALKAARVRMVGYVDTDYTRRSPEAVNADIRNYRDWYGLDGVFFDQVSSDMKALDTYSTHVLAARSLGLSFVVLNPGTHPDPGFMDLANVLVTFEGTWKSYQSMEVPHWVQRYQPRRICHLVHSTPVKYFDEGIELAESRHAGSVLLSDGKGSNPWDRIPAQLVTAVESHSTRRSR